MRTKPGLAPFRAERRLGEMMTEQLESTARLRRAQQIDMVREHRETGRGLSPPFSRGCLKSNQRRRLAASRPLLGTASI